MGKVEWGREGRGGGGRGVEGREEGLRREGERRSVIGEKKRKGDF